MFDPKLIREVKDVLDRCRDGGLRLATVESCTGGLLAAALTAVPGSSAVVERGYVTYSNEAKTTMVGVPAALITRDGAVSETVARAMAEGALERSPADIAVAITGIAGPAGGSAEKPVGLVHIAAARRGRATLDRRMLFGDQGRDRIRLLAVRTALVVVIAQLGRACCMKGAVVLLGVASIAAVAAAPPPPLAAHGAGVDEIAGYRLIAASEARRTGVPQQIVDAVMRVESGYDPMASGGAGEVGLMQILPGTAAMLGFRGTMAELREPHTNIRLGTAYLAQAWRLAGGDLCTTVMKYRAGHGETRFSFLSVEYCRRIRAYLATLGFPAEGPLPPATFGVPVPVLTDVAFTADATARSPVKKKKGDCFRRVVQAGKRFGACISKANFAAMGLLKGS